MLPTAAGAADRTQFVNSSERWLIVSRDQSCPDAPDVNARALTLQVLNEMFVQIVAADDCRLCESGFVQHSPRSNAEFCKVAAVETDAPEFMALFAKPASRLNRRANT